MAAPAGPTSHVYVSQRLRLHYVDWGNPEAPPLLLVHGGRDHCRNWDWIAQALRDDWHIIAPDLRGHGDSAWANDGHYAMSAYVYDLAQLIHQLKLAPVSIIAHSLGGNIATRYAGLYPENVRCLVNIEGLGLADGNRSHDQPDRIVERMTQWIEDLRAFSARQPRRYAMLDDAYQRMREENRHLSEAQARHLTRHGVNQNEDGTFSWKFDNYVRALPPDDLLSSELTYLWRRVISPVLLVYGEDSWATNPAEDGRLKHFSNARVEVFERAGHWVHHDRTQDFIDLVRPFLEAGGFPEGG